MLRRGEPAHMWFRRLFRRRRPPPPVLLPSLERLAELIERVVELLDEVALSPRREPAPPATPAANPAPDRVSSAVSNPGHSVSGHLLLISWPDGYRLLEREGAPPARRDRLDVDGVEFSVLRLGPSPLPGDWRRCAYLEREEPSTVDRTFDR
jgi:hypothetical protein